MNSLEMKEMFCKPTDERALLSYCFKSMDSFYDLVSKMTSVDFLYSDHSTLFTLLGALAQQDVRSFDLPMVINTAQQMFGGLDSIGGIEYVQSINEMRVSKDNYDIYLQNVLESSTKHKLYYTISDDLKKISENAKDGLTSEDLIGSIERKILDLKARQDIAKLGGGIQAIEKQHKNAFKSMDDLIEESKIAREKIENEFGLSDIDVSDEDKEEKYIDDDIYD